MGLLRIFLVCGLVALCVAGCGGSDDSASEAGDDGAETTATQPGEGLQADGTSAKGEQDGERKEDGSREDGGEEPTTPLTPAERREEEDRVRALVRELVDALNARDESVCSRLFDQSLIEPDQRDEALVRCEQDVAQQRPVKLAKVEIVRIRQTTRGREAGVQFLLSQSKRRTTRFAYHLVYKDGRYVIDRGIPVKQQAG